MKHSDIPLAQLIIDACKAYGISQVVISPGSRSAPLAISFTSDPFFKTYSIVDERVAGFFALGMARFLSHPVILVCTSGSALLNYYPAVSEAYYSQIPLLVISADRPFYKIDRGDGQTIRQSGVFSPHIGYEAMLQQDVSHAVEEIGKFAPHYLEQSQEEIGEWNLREVTVALDTAISERLPVHLNTPFEEPLYGLEDFEHRPLWVGPGPPGNPEARAGINTLPQELQAAWKEAERIAVLVGVQSPGEGLVELTQVLGSIPYLLVFTETTSNIHHPSFFNSIDSIIAPIEKMAAAEDEFSRLRPDLLLTIGGLVVSKKIKTFLRDYRPKTHWHLGSERANDTYFCLRGTVPISPSKGLFQLSQIEGTFDRSAGLEYVRYWQERQRRFRSRRSEYIRKVPFSDYWVFARIFDRVPSGYQLHLANSTTVRYAQLFDLNDRYRVYSNRGTSGIEGSTSSAIGSAVLDNSPTLLVTGDLSFFYDSNALWNKYTPNHFRVLLVNNRGGGIFRILPYRLDQSQYEEYFETTHDLNASWLCLMYGWDYLSTDSEDGWESALEEFFSNRDRPCVLEVFTPREINDKILLDYFKYLI